MNKHAIMAILMVQLTIGVVLSEVLAANVAGYGPSVFAAIMAGSMATLGVNAALLVIAIGVTAYAVYA